MSETVEHVAPTDRHRKPLLSDVDRPSRMVGIDTISLRGRVHRDTLRSLPLLRMKRKTDTTSGVVTDSDTSAEVRLADGVTLRADVWRGEPEVRLECSVPKRLRQDNTFAATIPETRAVIEDLWSLGEGHVRWECAPDELALMRLDVVRDFTDVTGAHAHLAGLARIPAERATTSAYMSKGPAGVQTLYRKTDRWEARLYVRSTLYEKRMSTGALPAAALRDLQEANRGRLRYELELKRPALVAAAIDTTSDLQDGRLWDLAVGFFRRCRFGEFSGDLHLKTRATINELMATMSASQVRGLLGQWVIDGLSTPGQAHSVTALKHRNAAKRHGLYGSELAAPWGSGTPRRLDFERGRMVMEAHP